MNLFTNTFFKFTFGFILLVAISLGIIVATANYDEQNGQEITCPDNLPNQPGGTTCSAAT